MSMLVAAIVPMQACRAASPPTAETPMPSDPSAKGSCRLDAVQGYVGQEPSDQTVAEIFTKSQAKRLRLIHAGEMVTMDFSPDRLNIELDKSGKIARITCG